MECGCAHDVALLEPVLHEYAGEKGGLIPILQRAQELYGWLSPGVLEHISNRTGIKPAKVMGVVTFYAQFRTKPVGKNLILLCQGTACHVGGSAAIEDAIKEKLGVGEGDITPDGLFTYSNVACIGCCSLAPVLMIDGKAYGGLTKEKAAAVLDAIARESAV
jgi:NADH-quinone oxidoreductase subunit E